MRRKRENGRRLPVRGVEEEKVAMLLLRGGGGKEGIACG